MNGTQPTRHSYGYRLRSSLDLDAAAEAVTAALKEQGFGVLMTLDLQGTLREKLGVERAPYTILGACNPALANQALSAEPEIGLLLPCNVVVYADDDGATVVSAVDPEALFAVVGRDDLAPLAQEVGARLRRALERLADREPAGPGAAR
jgi:uncharacterized protein (DUF302 family)